MFTIHPSIHPLSIPASFGADACGALWIANQQNDPEPFIRVMRNWTHLLKAGTPQCSGDPRRLRPSAGSCPACHWRWCLHHFAAATRRSEVQKKRRKKKAARAHTLKDRSGAAGPAPEEMVEECDSTCQCPRLTAQNRGETPRRLTCCTTAPCSSRKSHTSVFPRPAAAVKAAGEDRQRHVHAWR